MLKRIVALGALALAITCQPASAQIAPQLVGGYDTGGAKVHPLSIDALGRLNVVGSAAGSNVYGTNAIGTAPTQPPVFTGCFYNTTPGVVTNGQISGFQCNPTGSLFVNGGLNNGTTGSFQGLGVGGWDGTNYRHFKVTTGGSLYAAGDAVSGTTAATTFGFMVGGSDGTNYRHLHLVANGDLFTATSGNIASGSADSGAPVKIGGVYNSTLPTFTTGQRGDLQVGTRGSLNTQLCMDAVAVCATIINSSGDAISNSQSTLVVRSFAGIYNGTTWDRSLSANGSPANSTGFGVTSVANIPNSATASAIVPVVSSAAESNHVLKASAGNLYRVRVTATVGGYLMLFNATSAPVDGAVTPQSCTNVPANQTVEIDHNIPDRFSTGITAVFSSTGCFTKTASATAMIEGSVE